MMDYYLFITSIELQIFFSQNLVFLVFNIMENNTERIQIGLLLYVTIFLLNARVIFFYP